MRWAGHVERIGGEERCIQCFREENRGKETRLRWEINIEMDLKEMGWVGMEWIDLAQDRFRWRVLMNTAINIRVP